MSAHHSRQKVGDFEIHTLKNDAVSLSIAPELGGRVVSLLDCVSRREWLDGWTPNNKRRLWHPTDPADFETGPAAGLDECLPTIQPCTIGSSRFGDHGELWNQTPFFHEALAENGVFACRWALKSLPLTFERQISIHDREIRFHYQISNQADSPTPFLWAWHPLFSWEPGDQILTSENSCLAAGGERLAWPHIQPGTDLSRAEFPANTVSAAKVFLGPLRSGHAAISSENGASLQLRWPAELFPYAGIWITRGFWKGLHHWAIEPTNAPVDRLSDIKQHSATSMLAPREIREWDIGLTVGVGVAPFHGA